MGCSSLGFKKRFLEGLQEKMGWTRLLDESVIAPKLNPGEGQRGAKAALFTILCHGRPFIYFHILHTCRSLLHKLAAGKGEQA